MSGRSAREQRRGEERRAEQRRRKSDHDET